MAIMQAQDFCTVQDSDSVDECQQPVPNAINLVFQFASNHVVNAPFSINFSYGNIIANIGKHFKRKRGGLFRAGVRATI